MPKQIGNIADAQMYLDTAHCSFCGWMKYHFTLRSEISTKTVELLAQCSRCGRLKGSVREIESLLRPSPSPGRR